MAGLANEKSRKAVLERAAHLYCRQGRVVVCPVSRTKAGMWAESPPYIDLGTDVAPGTLGEELLRALRASRHGLKDLLRHEYPRVTPVMELYGVRTYWRFMVQNRLVSVRDRNGTIDIEPLTNKGGKGGFQQVDDPAASIALTNPTAVELGNAALEALKRAR